MRCVVDTNVFVGATVFPDSIPRQAVDKALDQGVLLFSEPTMIELREVLSRPRFDRYVDHGERALLLAQLGSVAEFVPIIRIIRECRDPKDDKFLEVALNGRGDVIITGDEDLLAMNPWRGVAIVSPAEYIAT
jgi:putative PIN family toxin of toxin-antitoxin system